MQKLFLTLFASLFTISSVFALSTSFSDIDPANPDHFADSVRLARDREWIQGYSDGTFRPTEKVRRDEFTKIVVRALLCQPFKKTDDLIARWDKKAPFPDISSKIWHFYLLAFAREIRLIHGFGDGLFHPDWQVTRAEAVAIVLRATGIDLLDGASRFLATDLPDQAWFLHEINTALENNIITLDKNSKIKPNERLNRAELVDLVVRTLPLVDCTAQNERFYKNSPNSPNSDQNNIKNQQNALLQKLCLVDQDNDGFSAAPASISCDNLNLTDKFGNKITKKSGDCNDNNRNINPSVIEICRNQIDDNCDGQIDEKSCTNNVTPNANFEILKKPQ